MFIKILGAIDLASSLAFLMLIFGLDVFTPYLLFCAGLLFVKGIFFIKDILSVMDLIAAVLLVISIFFVPWAILLWIISFFLLAKGFVSFL